MLAYTWCDPWLAGLSVCWRIPGVIHGWLALVLAVLCGMSSWIADSRESVNFFHSPSVVSWSHLFHRSALRPVATALRPFQSALAYKARGIRRCVCFFFQELVLISQYGMQWWERPGTTSTRGTKCGQFVRSKSSVFTPLVGSLTSCSRPFFI